MYNNTYCLYRQLKSKKYYKLHHFNRCIYLSKKFDINRLSDFLRVLDPDEGIRIKNLTMGKTFFINRNLFGTYNILVRTTEVHKKHENNFKKTEKIIKEFYNFNEMEQVIKFIVDNSNSQEIWVY